MARIAAAPVLDPTRAELRGLLELHALEVAALGDRELHALLPVLEQARNELNRDLSAWLAAHKGDARYTPQAYRQSLLAIDAGMQAAQQRLAGAVAGALMDGDAIARALAAGHTATEFLAFARAGFAEALPYTEQRLAAILATGRESPAARYESSAQRYAGQVGKDIRRELAVGVARGETLDALAARMQRLGGPSGVVALRGVTGRPGAVTEVIPEGLFRRYGYWAERLVRTETAAAYDAQLTDVYSDLHADLPDLRRRWDATADGRVCSRCQELGGKVIDPAKSEDFAGVPGPPLHPNCRCRAGLWRESWSRFVDPRTIHPVPSPVAAPPKRKVLRPAPLAPAAPAPPPHLAHDASLAARQAHPWRGKPPHKFASIAEAETWGRVNYPHITWDLAGTDAELMAEVLEQFHKLAQEWPEVAERLQYFGTYRTVALRLAGTPERATLWGREWAHASVDGRRLGLNPAHWGNAAKLRADVLHSEAIGWCPAGNTGPRAILTHEFGHQVDHWIQRMYGSNARYFLSVERASGFGGMRDTLLEFRSANKATAALSRYALTNTVEAWAESFAAVYHTPRAQWSAYTSRQHVLLEQARAAVPAPSRRPSWSEFRRGAHPIEAKAMQAHMQDLATRMGIKNW